MKHFKKILLRISKILSFIFKASLILGVTLLFAVGLYITPIIMDSPEITENTLINATAGTTKMYDRQGNLIYLDSEMLRDYIKIDVTPQLYKDLLLSTENKDYYTENGFSLKGWINAGMSLFKEKVLKQGEARGGSTIENQLIKNLVFSTNAVDRTIERKIKENYLSIQMDKNFTKDQILEWYINLIYLGENSYGANTVAITYYGNGLETLSDRSPQTISKLAIIAGLGQSPSAYNLYDNPEAVEKRRNEVLYKAHLDEVITDDEYNQALAIPVQEGLKERFWRNNEVIAIINQNSAYVSSALEQVKELGYDIKRTPLQIHTGLNQETNTHVKNTFDNYWGYEDDQQQIATTVIDNHTGLVLAEYGGRYSEAFGLNRATQRTRSSGSAIKPFLSYGPAIEYFGFGSGYRLDSSPYLYPGTNFVANNYGGAVYGIVDMAFALKLSLNTPANRLLDGTIGSSNAKRFLSGFGLDIQESYGGSDALGLHISTRDLAGGFYTLANGGIYQKPQYITKIVFNDGSEKQISFEKKRAMKESTAYILNQMLEEVPTPSGTAIFAQIPEYAGYAVKTGTVGYANDDGVWRPDSAAMDNWIAGTTKNVSIAVWTGYDSPNEPNNYISYGNRSYQILFKDLMLHFNNGKDTSDWSKPNTVIQNGPYYNPIDENSVSSKYIIPNSNINVSPELAEYISNKKKIKISDQGTPSYPLPEDADAQINWENSIQEKEDLNKWKTYNTPREALAEEEKVFFE